MTATACPIEVPAWAEDETAAQKPTEPAVVGADTTAGEDAPVDHTGEPFELDLGTSVAPTFLFSVLTALAVLVVVAAPVVPVQLAAGVVGALAALAGIRAASRRRS